MLILLTATFAIQAQAISISADAFAYTDGSTELEGYLARPQDTRRPIPGILVFHDWTGLDEYEKKRARMLAELGYVVLAADTYGKGVRPSSPKENADFATRYKDDRKLYRSRVNAALKALRLLPIVDAKRVAVVGYCFGGTGALELARSGADVQAVVSFHGGLDTPTPQDAQNIKCKILILHGANDPFVPPRDVEAFHQEMRAYGVDYVFITYGGAVHSFTDPAAGGNPTSGSAYNESADKRSWQATRTFLEEVLK